MSTLSPPPLLSPIAVLAAAGHLTPSQVWTAWFTQLVNTINANSSSSTGASVAKAFYFGS